MPVKRYLPLSCLRLHVIELLFIEAFVHDDAITQHVFPSQGQDFANAHGRKNDQNDNRPHFFADSVDSLSICGDHSRLWALDLHSSNVERRCGQAPETRYWERHSDPAGPAGDRIPRKT